MENTTTEIVSPEHIQERDEIVQWASDLAIATPEDYTLAAERLKGVKALKKSIKEDFAESKKSAKEAHAAICNQERGHLEPVEQAERMVATKLGEWYAEEERKCLDEQRRLEEEQRKRAEEDRLKQAAEAEAAGHSDIADAMISEPVITTPVVVASTTPKVAGLAMRENWKFEVVDPNAVPRNFLIVDTKAIGALVRAQRGACNIPGVKVWSEKVPVGTGR